MVAACAETDAPNVSAAAIGSIHLGVMGGSFTSVLAATCSVCCSWTWKILRPVCSTISGTIGTPLGARHGRAPSGATYACLSLVIVVSGTPGKLMAKTYRGLDCTHLVR